MCRMLNFSLSLVWANKHSKTSMSLLQSLDEEVTSGRSGTRRFSTQGASIPLGQWCISLCFRFPPYFRKCFRLCRQFFQFHLTQNLEFSPYFWKINISPFQLLQISLWFLKFTCFFYILCVFRFPPTLTMMHLCITQCTYWTPLQEAMPKPNPERSSKRKDKELASASTNF